LDAEIDDDQKYHHAIYVEVAFLLRTVGTAPGALISPRMVRDIASKTAVIAHLSGMSCSMARQNGVLDWRRNSIR
jgi:hypothetical protein